MGTEDKIAMVYGRTLWKDFVTFSICQYSILVSTYLAATGGNKMRVCHVGKVYNFCRRYKSKDLAMSPVMDNTEQLKHEATGNLDIPISKRKFLSDNKRLDALGGTRELKRF